MRLYTILFLTMLASLYVKAQEKLIIRQGGNLQYSVSVDGQTFSMFFQIDSFSRNYCGLTWSFENGRAGRFMMRGSSLDSAALGYWSPPFDGEEVELPASQGILMFSRKSFSSLQTNGKAMFDQYAVAVKSPPADRIFKVNDKIIDALYLESESGAKIWILNDPAAPLILRMENNPFGVDVELKEIQ